MQRPVRSRFRHLIGPIPSRRAGPRPLTCPSLSVAPLADKRTARTLRRCHPACCRQTRHDASAKAPVTSLRRLRQKHATQMTLARRAHRPLGPARAPINATSDVDSEGRCKANGPDGEQPGENMAGSSIRRVATRCAAAGVIPCPEDTPQQGTGGGVSPVPSSSACTAWRVSRPGL